jgi:curli production assembly/transport component CsgF
MLGRHAVLLRFGAFIVLVSASPSFAGQLVYQPINPSFGGNPFNSQHLLGIANAIDKYQDPAEVARQAQQDAQLRALNDPKAEFARTIQSSLLSQISQQISSQIYGEKARPNGTFQIGDTNVSFFRSGPNTVVDITDSANGGTTRISIPTPVD